MTADNNAFARIRNLLGLATRTKPVVGVTPADVVHRENKWRLLRYRARTEGLAFRTPILLVPSLINRHYVLDLMPGKSFAESMVARGHDVFIVDWGTPGPEDRHLTFDDICDRYLGRAILRACRAGGSDQVHLLGYCLGGTLTTIHAAVRPERVASMVALAAPIDFDDGGILSDWINRSGFSVGDMVDAFGNVPWQLMQASFHLLVPTLPLRKAVGVIERAWDDQFLDGFFAIERWGSDNVPFPGACYRQYIQDLYVDNRLVRGEFCLSGRPADLAAIDCPLLVITFEDDHIVPAAGAKALVDRVSSRDLEHLHLPGGHVGAVISRKASQTLWPAISEWWAARDGQLHAVDEAGARGSLAGRP